MYCYLLLNNEEWVVYNELKWLEYPQKCTCQYIMQVVNIPNNKVTLNTRHSLYTTLHNNSATNNNKNNYKLTK